MKNWPIAQQLAGKAVRAIIEGQPTPKGASLRAIAIPPTADPMYEVELPDEMGEQLQTIHEVIGGYLEMILVPSDPRIVMWADEEGKLMRRPVNARATLLAQLPGDMVVGTIVVTGRDGADMMDIPYTVRELELKVNKRPGPRMT